MKVRSLTVYACKKRLTRDHFPVYLGGSNVDVVYLRVVPHADEYMVAFDEERANGRMKGENLMNTIPVPK